MPKAEDITRRAQEAGEELLGTCKSIDEAATAEEQGSRLFCEALDETAVLCSTCGWWCDPEEFEGDTDVCADCEE